MSLSILPSAILVVWLALSPHLCAGASPLLEVAWKNDGKNSYALLRGPGQAAGDNRLARPEGESLDSHATTPLGSLWKLFVYLYLAEKNLDPAGYACSGANPAEEAFCCRLGESVRSDEALVRSCSLFFDPSRLGITSQEWRSFWQSLVPSVPWLHDLGNLRPATVVTVASLLDVLEGVPPGGRGRAEEALSALPFAASLAGTVSHLGSRMRVKTWTWDHPGKVGVRIGGFAGWLPDGTPVWCRGEGTSAQVLREFAPLLGRWLDGFPVRQVEKECVLVHFFDRYPVQKVVDLEKGEAAASGPLDGVYRVEFTNGNRVEVRAAGELGLERTGDRVTITGRMGLNEYVARVVDREGATAPREAAKALAVVARTYVIQTGGRHHGCLEIADTSSTQRVSPNPPTEAARKIAAWSDGLVLKGAPVLYHRDRTGPHTLSWNDAVRLDREGGKSFDEILAAAYPGSSLASLYAEGGEECERLPRAEAWLSAESPRWRRTLAGEAGFEPPDRPAICRLLRGNPRADLARVRIYVRGLRTRNDRIDIAHEYLHLAFERHPRGSDEAFIETMARRIVGE